MQFLKSIGKLTTVRADQIAIFENAIEPQFNLIVVDSTNVDRPERLVERLREDHPERRIVVLADKPTWQMSRNVIEAGANNILPTSISYEELCHALQIT